DQQWTLNHTGNWDRDKVDLNGDGDFVDTDELDDTRTHNAVNELTLGDHLKSGQSWSGQNRPVARCSGRGEVYRRHG
ncbi:MAG: hypothetical protein ACSLE4_02875, partial [Methyloceanibacter sp.]|uniref:hypothetical protein n=1 Tax=Methyloceanibacter sp. TaxID=1965321 RepID=UPI003EE06567